MMQKEINLNELIPGILNHEYQALSGLSSSQLKTMIKSPAHYKSYMAEPRLDIFDKKAVKFNVGHAFHAKILEPVLHNATIRIEPVKKTGKGATGWKDFKNLVRSDPALVPLSENNAEMIQGMRDSIFLNPNHLTARKIIESAWKVEHSIFWEDPTHGFLCKCRPDFIARSPAIAVDLKSCTDASENAFKKDIEAYDYDAQAVWYLAGINSVGPEYYNNFIWIAVEKTPPFEVGIYRATEKMLQRGRDKVRVGIERYAKCIKEQNYPGYPNKIIEIDPVGWAKEIN